MDLVVLPAVQILSPPIHRQSAPRWSCENLTHSRHKVLSVTWMLMAHKVTTASISLSSASAPHICGWSHQTTSPAHAHHVPLDLRSSGFVINWHCTSWVRPGYCFDLSWITSWWSDCFLSTFNMSWTSNPFCLCPWPLFGEVTLLALFRLFM